MKGWVYVITNAAMPGLVKVGFTMNDPEIRARELNHTGSPHPYIVAYEMLVDEPRQIEQSTHKLLSPKLEKKEWFRCGSEEAIAAIKLVVGNNVITENYKAAERLKAEEMYRKQEEERKALAKKQQELYREQQVERDAQLKKQEAVFKQQQAEAAIENQLVAEESEIRRKYDYEFKSRFSPWPFFYYWLAGAVISYIGITNIFYDPKADYGAGNSGVLFFPILISSFIVGSVLQSYIEKERKKSTKYLDLINQQKNDLDKVRLVFLSCNKCGTPVRVDRKLHLTAAQGTVWICETCPKVLQKQSPQKKNSSLIKKLFGWIDTI